MKRFLIGLTIILLAFFFRFNNLNWDANFHLHPDERFLTMVGNAMKLPTNVNQYFDQKTSLLNPSNIGYNFFVYGRFPLIFTKFLAVKLNLDNYNDFTIFGRQLSAFFDLLIILFVIKTVGLLEKKLKLKPSIKYWAGFFYAISVLPIQLSHFFAVDTFLNFFMFGSFYFALRVGQDRPLRNTILSAVFFGLALACKITAIFILPLNLILISLTYLGRPSRMGKHLLLMFIYLGVSYLTLRLADPYLFQNKNLFDPTLSKVFIENIKSLKNMTVKNIDNWFPPMVQWLNKNSFQHSIVNNTVFGMGIALTILLIFGILKVILSFPRRRAIVPLGKSISIFVILTWVVGFFIYQSLQVTPTLRYFITIYPFLAIFAAFGINVFIDYVFQITDSKLIRNSLFVILIIVLLIWPIMFSSIYFNKHTRVEASEWIYKNLPSGSYILSESWDDSLPLSVVDNYGKQFAGEQLPVFDPDTPEKWRKINESLKKADYYILSSNRGWGSITTVPKKYPKMSKFYVELLDNKNPGYKKIKEFTSFPQFTINNWQLAIDDSWSDEGFTVYDHPKVLIYKNVKK